MAVIVKQRAHIMRLVLGAVLWCSLAACMGHLVYRPEKKIAPAAAAVTATNSDLPPMPDPEANDATLAGIDTAGIGVRDDVHIWIYANYTTIVKRTILMTMANALQNVLVTPPRTPEEAKSLNQSYKDAAMMLKLVRGLTQSGADEMDEFLFGQEVNTPARLKAYLQYNLLLSGGKAAH
ncbi:MAG: hypothetical protein ABSA86_13560 [Oryzomonas sp.]